MDYEKFCDLVLNLDHHIRYVGFHNQEEIFGKMSDDYSPLLNPEETKKSFEDAKIRWQSRNSLSHKMGQQQYSMTQYEKIQRISIPYKDDILIMVSMDTNVYHETLTKEIMEFRDMLLTKS